MKQGVENIGKKDVIWSYLSQIFSVGAGVILLPFIVTKMPTETVGIWNIFQTITIIIFLLDFGFNPSFARSISYIFSGIQQLRKEGVETQDLGDTIDYSLLKGTLQAMRKIYRWIAVAVFGLLATVGSWYIYFILQKYTGNQTDIIIAWGIFIVINSYNFYTFYYDSLLLGKGYVKQLQQITILGQALYLALAIILIYAGLGLTAIVTAQLLSVVVRRILAHRIFFTTTLKELLAQTTGKDEKQIIRTLLPNASKVGLITLGDTLTNRSATLIGAGFLSLGTIASYGITMQVIIVICRCSKVYFQSHIPQIAQYRAQKDVVRLRRLYNKCVVWFCGISIMGSILLVALGDWGLTLINSDTSFLPFPFLCTLLIFQLLDNHRNIAEGFLTADNKVPFYIPAIIAAIVTIVLLWICMDCLQWGIWGMILVPGLVQTAYQNWKWPAVIIKELYFTHKK